MSLDSPGTDRLRFDEFEANLQTQELFRQGQRLRLPNQSFLVLAMLLQRPGQLVTREELRQRLWGEHRVVEFEQGLNAIVNRLREALGDRAEDPKFVETLPRRGYRFIATVTAPSQVPASADHVQAPADQAPITSVITQADSSAPANITPRRGVLLAAIAVIATVLGVLTLQLLGDGTSGDSSAGKLVPLTSLLGQEVAPTFSPDGSRVAFAWDDGSESEPRFDLFAKAVDSEQMLRLTHRPARALSAAWAPDGTRIAIGRWAYRDEDSGIFLVPALGGAERRLAPAVFASELFMQISWSPDAKLLAYAEYSSSGSSTVRLLQLDELTARPLHPAPECWHAGAPAFSPDGKQLAFVCMSTFAMFGVYVTALPSGPPQLLASIHGEPKGLAWSSDGTRLAIANDSGEGGSLWQLTLDGKLTQLAVGTEAAGPGLTVLEDRIAYARMRQTFDIWRIDLSAPQPEASAHKLISSTRAQMTPQYSPDAARIAFQSNRSGSHEIWLTDARGENAQRLTSFGGPMTGAPTWCSDGRRIAFDSRASGASAVYVMDVAESVPRRLETPRENLAMPVWSEDCRWLFASDGKGSLHRIPSSGGPAERFTTQHSYYAVVVGDRVVFNVTQPNGVTLWSKQVAGGAEEHLEGMPVLAYSDSWTATRHGIYYTSSQGEPTVSFYDFATRTVRRLASLPHAPAKLGGLGLSVSADGRWLLYTHAGSSQSDIMLLSGWQR